MYNFSIYCSAYIVSELDYDVNIYGNLLKDEKNEEIERYYILGGQTPEHRIVETEQPQKDEDI